MAIGEVSATVGEICEVIAFLELPSEARVALANLAVGCTVPPPYLDDRVLHVARESGYTKHVSRGSIPTPGDIISATGKWRTVVTEKGRALLEANPVKLARQ